MRRLHTVDRKAGGLADARHIERIRTDHHSNILMKGWKQTSKFYVETSGTKEFKLDKFHAALIAIGKDHAVSFSEYSRQNDGFIEQHREISHINH